MPTTTPNLGLTKDYEGEPYSLARINANSDRLDTFAGEALTDTVYDTTGIPALIKKRKIADVETPVTIETPDTTPTEGSKHLITSGAVHAALGSKQDELTQEQLAAANSGITAEKLTADEAALAEVVDNGAKNHLYCDMNIMKSANTNGTWSGNSFTHNSGVTFTINSDSSITVNGTASDVNGVFVLSTDFTISQGDWILSGTPNGGSSSTYNITIAGVISDIGVTARFNSATNKLVRIYVLAGTTANNLLFKPMICSAADYAISPAFVPYALTNPELTAKLMTDEADITSMRHMVDPRSQSQVSGGNLDNITVSEIRVYIAPSGLPTGVSASSVCIVETCVVDSNSSYQVITLLSNQGSAQDRSYPTYKRVKVGGVWYDWKLIVS